jgi:DNA-directed RNA polymerase specialized sigma subunit
MFHFDYYSRIVLLFQDPKLDVIPILTCNAFCDSLEQRLEKLLTDSSLARRILFMDRKNCARTLLSALSSFGQFLMACDREIQMTAENSYASYRSAEDVANSIIDQIHKSYRLRTIRSRTESLLETLPQKTKKVLMLYYIHDIATDKIAVMLDCSRRTVFRKIKSATELFAKRAESVGLWIMFEEIASEQIWLRRMYERILHMHDGV